jgi:hypothetical protein
MEKSIILLILGATIGLISGLHVSVKEINYLKAQIEIKNYQIDSLDNELTIARILQ